MLFLIEGLGWIGGIADPEAKKPVPGQNGRERLWACCVGGGVVGTVFPECLTGVQRSAPILYLISLYQKAIFFF